MIIYAILLRIGRLPLCKRRSIAFNAFFVCCLLSLYFPGAYGDGTKKIVLLMSGDTQAYTSVARSTLRGIKKKCPSDLPICNEITIVNAVSGTPLDIPEKDIYMLITFGTKAASNPIAREFAHEMIAAMIPRQGRSTTDDSYASDKLTKVYIDQPYTRYFALIKAVAPRSMRIGVLLHSSDSYLTDALQEAAKANGMTLKIGLVESGSEIGESLSRLLGNIDVLLALPDSRIHNSRTISNILTTSYRNHIPVIGFSSAYVKAGATAAVYTSLANIADQVSDIAIQILTQGKVQQRDLHAKYFSVSLNFEVSRSLDIPLTSPSEVIESMKQELSE